MPRNRLAPPGLAAAGARLQSAIDGNPMLAAAVQNAGAIIVVASFLVVSMTLYVMGNGIPYVMDNNETFSSLNHAHNLWHFDFFRSYGLADEAASPDAAAHPVVHSHQGNFPRLFAFLIYVLGARSAESQILVTTLTIGVASMLMAYAFFSRVAGPLFATVTLLAFTTDYLLFAQWQVNTYRVWHTFFLFGALLCVHGYAEWRPRYWLPATFLLYLGLFYWELVFAVFTTLTAGFYTLWVYRRRWRAILASGFVQGAGAFCGLAVVITQLALYLGWDGFVQDVTLTLTARNYAPDDMRFIETLRNFYENRNIAFFYNVQSAGAFAGPLAIVRSLFANVLEVPSPLLSLLALSFATAALMSDSRLPCSKDTRGLRTNPWLASMACVALGAFVLLLALFDDGRGVLGGSWWGLRGDFAAVLLQGAFAALLAAGVAFWLCGMSEQLSITGAPPRLGRGIRAGLFLGLIGLLIANQGQLYDRSLKELWLGYLTPVPVWLGKALISAAAALGSLIILTGRRSMLGRWHNLPNAIGPYLVCTVLAFACVYRLSAGYVHSGYLFRLCPLPVFFFDVLLALGAFTAFAVAFTLARRAETGSAWVGTGATATVAAASGLVVAAMWITVQLRYLSLLPPSQFAFVKVLEPGLDGEGILSNTYPMPFGITARTWAYMRAPDGQPTAVPSDARSAADNPYVWLADRRSNAKYWRPAYYVCFFQPATMAAALANLGDEQGDKCSRLDIVSRAIYGASEGSDPEPDLVARDTVSDRWAIVRLKWAPSIPSGQ